MDSIDEYMHKNSQILYFPRSIPTKEVEASIGPTSIFCQCLNECSLVNGCTCVQQSGSYYSYKALLDLASYVLNDKPTARPTYECNDQCSCCDLLCGNKLIQCGPRKNLTVKLCSNETKGEGLFTESAIGSGNFICEYAGEIISESEASARYKINANAKKMNYIFCIDEYFGDKNVKTFIDPMYYGNIGRYVNHSCEPNSTMVIARINETVPILSLFASRDIEPGEEITYDYGITDVSHLEEPSETDRTKCLCNSNKCRKFLPYDTRLM
ncbi:probable histone-lysine N-methyltransferase set-23 [Cylas formicarius]|uniref:probable histone-lysine N-methyltransferase set-23 n=1 Tax=Cylas formicarius TaxID=197179 RepID=UPI0029589862|nr:probable histone-lysine N-methyltransferase set-23 [Cylas formicarius]